MKKLSKNESLVNLSNSIYKFYGLNTFHETYGELDKILKTRKNKKVTLILLDAFSKNIMEEYKNDIPFIYSHIHSSFYSIYPPTTVAATTAVLTGRYPCENGYTGWSQYFQKYDDLIDVFPSVRHLGLMEKVTPEITSSLLKIDNIVASINKNTTYKARELYGFKFKNDNCYLSHDLDAFFIEADAHLDEFDFNYLYHPFPDAVMHVNGKTHENVAKTLQNLDIFIKKLVENHPETLFILIADHGMIDIKEHFVLEFDDFANSLSKPYFMIEGRFAGFFVKDKDAFISSYNKHYKNDYILKSKEELLSENIFGYSTNYNKYFLETLGDYFLIAKTNLSFNNDLKPHFLATHAGSTKEELELNMCIFNKE